VPDNIKKVSPKPIYWYWLYRIKDIK